MAFPTPSAAEEVASRILSHTSMKVVSPKDCQVYKRRWLMLTIYSACAVSDAMHWTQYTIIQETIQNYYGVSLYVIDFTAVSIGVMYVIFAFPAIYLIERFGLKKTLIFGDVIVIAASGLKLISVNPNHFYIGFTGQFLAGIAQVFVLNVPSYLAGLWFPENEVSTACALGILGTQIGAALSFFVPPQLISLGETFGFRGSYGAKAGLIYVYGYQLILPVLILPLLIFVFKSHPPKPPSYARLTKENETIYSWKAVKELFSNVNYILLLVSYSMSVSVFYCISIFIGQIITRAEFAGTVGATIILFGIAGNLFFGWLLDKTHQFKIIALVTYVAATVGLVIFWVNAMLEIHDAIYIISASILGIFLASYVIIAIEFASELTYPISETVSTTVLLAFGEMMAVVIIYGSEALMVRYGQASVFYTMLAFLVVGLLPTSLIRGVQLKRYEASQLNAKQQDVK